MPRGEPLTAWSVRSPGFDIVVIGGGIQGLLALDMLMREGYATALVTGSDLGAGQTLHSHGFLNTGFGLVDPELPRGSADVVQPDLRERGVEPSGEWALIAPPNFPPAVGLPRVSLPSGFAPSLADAAVRLPERSIPKRGVVDALSEGRLDRMIRGHATLVMDGQRVEAVVVHRSAASEELVLSTKAVIVAAGCGSKRLVETLVGPTPQMERIKHRRVHMLCARGPSDALPGTSVLAMPLLLLLAAHARPEDITWYVTPMEFGGPSFDDIPEDAASDVDREVLARGWTALLQLYPALSAIADLRLGSYAGYRQDVGDQAGVRACEVVDGLENVIVALPSGLVAPWLNVITMKNLLRELLEPSGDQPAVPSGGLGVRVGQPVEDRPQFKWMTWNEWFRAYPELPDPR